MMKSFFKKLAFVMALAMVVSMVAPAGSALAAETGVSLQGTKTIVETWELDKVGATVDFSFQGAPKDWKTTFAWTSSNTAVATVDKAGVVTAVAAGTATITITAGADASYKETVVVTVKEAAPVVAKEAFEVKQTSTNAATLTFDVPATGVTVDTLEVIWLVSDLEIELNKKNVTVKDNVATVELNDNFVDGGSYIFRYNGTDVKYTASAGELTRVGFSWYTDDAETGAGQAFVNTDEEIATTVLVPHFYDANGVDVTANYDVEGDFEITYTLATESDSYDLIDNELTFNAISQAVVNMAVTWQDDEGEDHTLYGVDAIVAVKRPAVKFTFVKGGFLHAGSGATDDDNNIDIVTSFTTDINSTAWKKATTTWTLGDEVNADGSIKDLCVAALLKDNRGNTIVTGMEQGEEDGQYPFGHFTFASSKDTVLGVDENGVISVYEPGRASVLVYFVPVDAEDEDAEKVLVGAVKVTVKEERYAATYKMTVDTNTQPVAPVKTDEKDEDDNYIYVANDRLNKTATVVLKVYDQYGATYGVDEGAITVTANSSTNTVEPHTIEKCGGCSSYGWDTHYHIKTSADEFASQVKAASSKSFKYTVTVDTDAYDKITTKSDSYTLKMTNVNKYYSKLVVDLTDAYEEGDAELENFYISGIANKSASVDLKIAHVHDWDNLWAEGNTKDSTIWLNYLSASNGLSLEGVPADRIVPVGVDENGKVTQTTGLAGVVYYKDTTSGSKVKGKMNVAPAAGKIVVSWPNTTEEYTSVKVAEGTGTYFKFTETGTYKLTLYTAKEDGAKLSAKTYTYSVKNSTAPVVYAGYNPETGNEADDIEDIEAIIKNNLVFTLDGMTLDLEEGNVAYIVDYELGAVKDDSVTIRNVTFAVRVDDGDVDTADSNDYYLCKKVRVGKTIVEK